MKKISLIFIATICALGIITGLYYSTQTVDFRKLTTDSGFDSSFDSGGSSWDSGGSSWDSGGSSGGGDGEFTAGDAIAMLITFGFVGFIFFIMFISYLASPKYTSSSSSGGGYTTKISDAELDLIRKYGYDPATIIMICYNRYVDIQVAWSQNNIEKAKDILTNDLYNMYKGEIVTLKAKKQRNEMNSFKYVGGQLLSVTESDDTLNIKIALQVQCKDYMVDDKTNAVLRGSASKINHYDYRMTFIVSKNESSNACPNCNAPIKDKSNTVTCEYCGSTIVRKTNNIVLARKEMFKQW